MSDIAVVIPAAGTGRRMKSFGPKALLPLGDGRTVLRRQIDTVRQVWPGADVVVVVGYDAERVVKTLPAGVRVVENEHYEETGAARSVAMGLRATAAGRVLVLYGDLVFNKATLAGLPADRSVVLVDSKKRLPASEVGVTTDGGLAVHFDYGLKTKWCSIALLAGRELHLFKQLGAHKDRRRLMGFEVLNLVVERGGELYAHEAPKMRLVEIDSGKDIARARKVQA
jgi:choline kinase